MTELGRRTFLTGSALAAATSSARATAAGPASGLRVEGLRTSQLVNPLGLADPRPSLSWRLVSARRGTRQAAYRIRAASSAEALSRGGADLWDSGRVASSTSTGIPYGGAPARSRQRVWWTVTIWDETGADAVAEPGWWEMGLLVPADWTAAWLAAEDRVERQDREAGMPSFVAAAPEGKDASRLFRLPFTTEQDEDAVLTLFSSGFLRNVTIDGKPLDVPPHPWESFGGPPAMRISLPLPAGRHMLAAEVTKPRSFVPAKEVTIAVQIRLRSARINRGWQTAATAADGWRLAGSSDRGWDAPAMQAPQPVAPWPAGPAIQLRKAFRARARPVHARLYVAALGAYEIRLNGRKVGDHLLESETTDFRKTVLARTYDVTELLVDGQNMLGAIVGDGWYASYAAPVGRYAYGPAPRRLIAQLEIVHADGTIETVTTDADWRSAPSPILRSEIYNGEAYDARLEMPGWDTPGFDAAGWQPASTTDTPPAVLTPFAGAPIRVVRRLQPIATTRLVGDRVVVDFGQNFAGFAQLYVKGERNRTVTMRFAEILKADGSIDQANLRAARATDIYTLGGALAGESFTPRFTYHGFRYVELSGLPAEWRIEGLAVQSDLPETGTLSIDHPTIGKLWLNTLWSQRSNFVAIPTDCPQRDERLGWTGDAQIFWDAAAYNMDVGAFTRRFLRSLRDNQGPTGAFPIFAPTTATTMGGSPGWADAGVMLPWIAWRRYGDVKVVAEHWDAIRAYLSGVIADNPDLVWRVVKGPNFADWLSLDAKTPNEETTPRPLAGTAMLKRSLDQMAEMSDAIGKSVEAAAYRAQAETCARAFRAAFVKSDGMIGNGSQTSYILAIRLGLLTPEQKRIAGERLAGDIRRRGTLLSTGFLGTPLSLDALADVGETKLVYDLLRRTDFPGWGYMAKRGATTIWERWNGDTGDVAMNSFNHYALGAISGFLFRRIAGIEETSPGFATFRVKPLLDETVKTAGARYDSVRGRIETRWKQTPNGLALDLVVPANARAEVHLPGARPDRIVESGRRVTGRRDMNIRLINDATVIEIGSGEYHFSSR